MKLITNIPVKLETEAVIESLRLSVNSPHIRKKIEDLIDSITPIMKPKALYTESKVEYNTGNTISLDGKLFTSKVLGRNLENDEKCYPYIVTAGQELEEIELIMGQSIMLLDLVKNVVVGNAFRYTKELIAEKYCVQHITEMSPGHLFDWPLSQQRVLFNLFGSEVDKIGVRLTENLLMMPPKTVSGIFFSSESGFQSCQICAQQRCMGRKTEYDPNIAKEYGIESRFACMYLI
jgi:hypothetical protein